MKRQNETEHDSAADFLDDLESLENTQKLKANIVNRLMADYAEEIREFDPAEVEELVTSLVTSFQCAPLVEYAADRVAERVLFNPTSLRWWGDKIATALLVAGAGYVAVSYANKASSSASQDEDETQSGDDIFGASSTSSEKMYSHPQFSDPSLSSTSRGPSSPFNSRVS